MSKALIAFCMGLFSFLLLFIIVEPLSYYFGNVGSAVAYILTAAYFFICQFFLSRGNPVGTGCRTSLLSYPYGIKRNTGSGPGPGHWHFALMLWGHIGRRVRGVQGSTQEG